MCRNQWAVLRTFIMTATTTVLLAACAGGGSTSTPASGPGRGQEIAKNSGCASCHGSAFRGGVGPSWVALAGSEVKLSDGSTVVADDRYLFNAIRDPGAEIVAGFGAQMPRNSLSDEDINEIIAFIKSLTD